MDSFTRAAGPIFLQDALASRALYETCADIIVPKACYDNIYHIATESDILIAHKEYHVAYGGIEVDPVIAKSTEGTVFLHHCFILDVSEELAIDPTMPNINNRGPCRYLVAVSLPLREYLSIVREGRTTDFWGNKALREYMLRLDSWGRERGYYLAG